MSGTREKHFEVLFLSLDSAREKKDLPDSHMPITKKYALPGWKSAAASPFSPVSPVRALIMSTAVSI